MSINALNASAQRERKGIVRRIGEYSAASALAVLALMVAMVAAIFGGIAWLGRGIARGARRAHVNLGDMKRTLVGLVIAAVTAFATIYAFAVQFSAFAAAVLMAVFGSALFYVIVRYGHSEIDLIQHLEEGNEAVPRHFFSYAFIIAGAIVGALVAGF